jgi:hypothetical protein
MSHLPVLPEIPSNERSTDPIACLIGEILVHGYHSSLRLYGVVSGITASRSALVELISQNREPYSLHQRNDTRL